MYEYSKAMRLCLAEFLTILALHIVYAFIQFDSETGRWVLLVSAVFYVATVTVAVLVKKEKFVVFFIFASVFAATSIIGYILKTLAFSILMFVLMIICITIFMQKMYISVSYYVFYVI